ncbi:leucine-rich repeat-containing protein 47-like [Coccinella septempunctata]|uniref:leucine-rich repeat-containing protein 47-like n=1 Tax=Coccinella septempunctata TaxID=41139 RepID=UPI001D06CA73|nr:leucine-rich repeat-containing protein 47-like [Coccinella septempunctata]
MWPEIELVKKENRHEIVLTGTSVNDRIKEDGLDDSLFDLTSLNYLCIHGTSITGFPDRVTNLTNLQILSLHDNKIDTLNPLIGKLHKLKTLDLSGNQLTEIPDIFDKLEQIVTINFSRNKITKFPTLMNNKKLTELNLSHNELEEFPLVCNSELTNLSELKLGQNQIKSIPNEINCLPALKILDVGSNKITSLPGNLADCGKLKEINLKQNPISDRRLLKLIDQCRTKQVLDYVKQHCPRVQTNISTNQKKGKKNQRISESADETSTVPEYKYKIEISHAKEDCLVTVSKKVETVRKYIICCVVQGVVFNESTFKKFIQLQNKIHENECGKRNSATIATHDYNKLGDGQLTYTTMKPDELKLKPLNRSREMTGRELFEKLQIEAENFRKEKKRNTYSGIHRYLYLIEGKPEFPCLVNSKQEVISFPPITNADISKMEVSTTDLFLEVTSSESLQICKNVMDNLLREMVLLFEADLKVLQIRTVDEEGTMKNVYPSKTDLNFKDQKLIQVIRSN